jgi:predicted TPR repeat methyltransferase
MSKITSARKPGARKKKKKISSGTAALLRRAHRSHREGRLQEAIQAYEQFLGKVPKHAETMGNLGLLYHSRGEPKQAVQLYEQALALDPQLWHLYYFLGNGFHEQSLYKQAAEAYQQALVGGADKTATLLQLGKTYIAAEQPEKGQECFEKILKLRPADDQAAYQLGLLFFQQEHYEQAVLHFSSVLSAQPDNADVCFNLALCHKALDHTGQALEFMHRANRIAPNDGDILYNIGVLYKNQKELGKAEDFFHQALKINPEHGICLTDLAILYHIQNRLDKAQTTYQKALDIGYHSDSASHMLAALKGTTTAATPLGHVRDLFNNFAGDFDHSLSNDLQYTVPAQLSTLFRQYNIIAETTLDLGCGTGLSGLAFRPFTRHLIGIDLSESMLIKAAEKNLYDELHCTDIMGFLNEQKKYCDLALAADVFVYLGTLEPFFRAVTQLIRPGGFLLFSVESCSSDYCLRQSGRYAHSAGYIADLAAKFQYTIQCCRPTGIRKERGEWIPGENYVLSLSS